MASWKSTLNSSPTFTSTVFKPLSDNDVALNLEREIGVFLISKSYDLSFRDGHNKIYNETSSYKALYNEDAYDFIW